MRQAQSFIQSRKEKVFTPHHALINAELFAFVINPMFKDSLPTGGFVGQELWAEPSCAAGGCCALVEDCAVCDLAAARGAAWLTAGS